MTLRIRIDIDDMPIYTITAEQRDKGPDDWYKYEWSCTQHFPQRPKFGGWATHQRGKGALELLRIVLMQIRKYVKE